MGEISEIETTQEALVERLRQGDGAAAALVMQRHNQALWRVARGILQNEADAEDAVQEAYVRAFTSLSEFRGESSLSTWLSRIVINEALRRASRRRPTSDLAELDEDAAGKRNALSSAAPDPEQAAARQQIRRMVERAVEALPAPFRVVFILRTIEQMSIEETAAALGIPAATVKTRLHRANQQLRNVLGAEFAAALSGAFPFAGARCERLTAAVLARLDPTKLGHGAGQAGPSLSTRTQGETPCCEPSSLPLPSSSAWPLFRRWRLKWIARPRPRPTRRSAAS